MDSSISTLFTSLVVSEILWSYRLSTHIYHGRSPVPPYTRRVGYHARKLLMINDSNKLPLLLMLFVLHAGLYIWCLSIFI